MVCASEGNTSTTQHKIMTNTELTLDQLQALSGGIIDGGCRPPIKHGVTGIECKVPSDVIKPQDGLVAVVII